jgi:hypothetical protein
MSTTTIQHPDAVPTLPEWRRICHYCIGDSRLSVCGTATRRPGEDHYEPECNARGHAICTVCDAIWEKKALTT